MERSPSERLGMEALVHKPSHQVYFFGDFTLNVTSSCLLHKETEVKLRPKSFEVLIYLVENSGRLVTKEELIRAVWPDTFVTDDSLVKCLKDVRVALRDDSQLHIKTVPRRGYVFTTTVREAEGVSAAAVLRGSFPASFPRQVESPHAVIDAGRNDEGRTSQIKEIVASHPTAQLQRLNRARHRSWSVFATLLAVLALSSVAILAYRRFSHPNPGVSAPVRSIAVLPLRNLSGDASNDYFSDGMTESLIVALSKVQGLTVISRGSVFPFKEKEVDPREVGRQLGVAAVLEGNVRKGADSVRVAVRLVSVEDGHVLWASDTYDRALGDIFAMQDEIASRVVTGLKLELGRQGEQQLAKRYTENVEAYQAYMKGRFFWNKRNGDGLGKAVIYFQRAIEIDPNYALAYAGLADSYILKKIYALLQAGETLPQMVANAKAAAEKALQLDDTLAEAHASLGMIKANIENDEAGIEEEYKRAIELNPNYATAHHWYALHLNDMSRFDEAIAEINRAREIDPFSLVINSDVGIILSSARRYDQAIEQFKKAMEMDPNFPDAHAMLGWTYVRKGMYKEAIAEFEKARALFGSPTSQSDGLIYAYGMSGNRSAALKVLARLKTLNKEHHTQIPWENWVYVHIGVGDHDQAFELLEKAYQEHLSVKRLLDSPYLDPLRSDPRFHDLQRRVGLELHLSSNRL